MLAVDSNACVPCFVPPFKATAQSKIRSGQDSAKHSRNPAPMDARHPRGRAWRRVHLLSAALHHNIKSVAGVSIHFFPASSVYNRVPSSFLLPSFSRSSSVCLHDSRSVRPSEDFGFSSRGLGNGRSSVHFSLSCIGVLLSLPSLLTNICPPTLFGRDFCTT